MYHPIVVHKRYYTKTTIFTYIDWKLSFLKKKKQFFFCLPLYFLRLLQFWSKKDMVGVEEVPKNEKTRIWPKNTILVSI